RRAPARGRPRGRRPPRQSKPSRGIGWPADRAGGVAARRRVASGPERARGAPARDPLPTRATGAGAASAWRALAEPYHSVHEPWHLAAILSERSGQVKPVTWRPWAISKRIAAMPAGAPRM